jgi:hypothetical protein
MAACWRRAHGVEQPLVADQRVHDEHHGDEVKREKG